MKGEQARNEIKGRVGPALYSVMEPGDDIVAGTMTAARSRPCLEVLVVLAGLGIGTVELFGNLGHGLNPGARAILGAVGFGAGMAPAVAQIMRKPVFVAVTQRQLICYRMSRFDHAPVRLVLRAAPTSVRITSSGHGRLWSSVRYCGPGARKRGLRLCTGRIWREDLDEVLAALQLAGAAVHVGTALPLVPMSTGFKP